MLGANITVFLVSTPLFAQKYPGGIWEGYDGEWTHVSQQLVALAEATPPEKFAWRPAAGVRSTSEVYMHIVLANFYLLSVTGPKIPADLKRCREECYFQTGGHRVADAVAGCCERGTPGRDAERS